MQHLLHAHPAISPLLVLVVSFIVFSQLNPRFASPGSLSLVLQQAAVIAALAVGQTLIILTAGIDLSVGAIAIFAMLVGAKLSAEHGRPRPARGRRRAASSDCWPAASTACWSPGSSCRRSS